MDTVVAIDRRCFPTPWSRGSYLAELDRPDMSHYLVAESEGELVGYTGAWVVADEVHVTTLGVSPEFRRQGIAERLLLEIIKIAWQHNAAYITLEYRVGNAAAERLYAKYGFRREGLRAAYYRNDNSDAIIATVRGVCEPEYRRRVDELRALWEERHGGGSRPA